MTTTEILPRIADMTGGAVDPAGYARLAALYSVARSDADIPAAERKRMGTIGFLLGGAVAKAGKGDRA